MSLYDRMSVLRAPNCIAFIIGDFYDDQLFHDNSSIKHQIAYAEHKADIDLLVDMSDIADALLLPQDQQTEEVEDS